MAHFPSDMTSLSSQQMLPGQNIGEGGGRTKTSTTEKTAAKEQDTIMHTSSPIPDPLGKPFKMFDGNFIAKF